MDALIACEESQEVCKALREAGHNAFSCDTQNCSGGKPEWHIKGDAIQALHSRSWDLVIAHPPCTRLTNAGIRWLTSKKPRAGYTWNEHFKRFVNSDESIWIDLMKGIAFFNQFLDYGRAGNKIAIENPVPHGYAREGFLFPGTKSLFFKGIGRPTQIIQPYEYGHLEKKATGLWLFGLPKLVPTNNVYSEMMKLPYSERAKIHYASPGPERAKMRSKTYAGIAKAISEQWSSKAIQRWTESRI